MSAGKKQRADNALLEGGLVDSRTKAQALIIAGKVFSGSQTAWCNASEPIRKLGPSFGEIRDIHHV